MSLNIKTKIATSLLSSALLLTLGAASQEVKASEVGGHTLSQAISWSASTNGASIDADGANGAQCVDLTMAYSQYLFGYTMMGYASDYSVTDYPGFTRLSKEQAAPQAGDIAVWVGGYGHVGIVTHSDGVTFTTMEQNVSGAPFVRPFTHNQGDYYGLTFWGVQRPNLVEEKEIPEEANGIYRLYNATNGDHLYTTDRNEAQSLQANGWSFDGVFFKKLSSGVPVYRMYNPATGEHFYTINTEETNQMVTNGWNNEGLAWYAPTSGMDVYRLTNASGNHVWTTNANEVSELSALGWTNEGVAFKG